MGFLRRSLIGVFLFGATFAFLAIAGAIVWNAVQVRMSDTPQQFGSRERIASVNLVAVEAATIQPEMTVFGDIRSLRTLTLRSPVAGSVIAAADNFVEGGSVKTGDLLVTIDPTEAETTLALARADLTDAEAELKDAETALIIAQDSLEAARAQADLRETALVRAQELRDRGTGTTADLETAQLAVASANSSVLSQRQSVAQAETRVAQAGTDLERVRLSVADAERTLADTQIYATFDGTLSSVAVLQGGRVTANETLAELIDPSALEVAFRVSTAQYTRLIDENGTLMDLPLRVTLDISGVTLEASGRLTRESATVADGQTGRLLYASLDAAPGLRPGDFVTVRVIEPPLDNVAIVPSTAVAADNTVLKYGENSRLELVSVELLRRQGDNVIISAENIDGASIVAERSPLLGAGIQVNPLTDDPAPETAAEPEMIQLDDARRAELMAMVNASPMPDDVKTRILTQLEQPEVPADVISRLENRIGG